jgi:putative hydrolase of the HAD superfamily
VTILLVDLDDTLLDYTGGVDACWEAACAGPAGPAGMDVEALVQAIARTRRWFWSDPERHRRERTDMLQAWRRIVAHALDGLGEPGEDTAAAIARDFAERRWATMRLFPDAREALERWRARGVRLALVTNGDASHQRRKVWQYDLARFFDVIVIEGEFGAGKPDESVYRHALERLGARPREAWMVGDHLEWDVAAPQRLGLRGIWLDRAGQGLAVDSPVRPDLIIRTLRDLSPFPPDGEEGIPPSSRPPGRQGGDLSVEAAGPPPS